jgi:SAM-dependent methyltransferase
MNTRLDKMQCRLCGQGSLSTLHREDFVELQEGYAASRMNTFAYLLCTNCGLVQVEPVPSPEALARYYRYAPVAGLDHEILRTVKDRYYQTTIDFLTRLPAFRPKRIFEVGAASGYLLHRLSGVFQAQAAGIEPSEESIRWARNEFGVELLPGMIEELDLKAHQFMATFDLIVCCSVLEHVAWPLTFMQKAGEMLRDGGYIYIEVPSLRHPQERELTEKVVQPFHLCYYTPASIALLGAKAGLACLHVEEVLALEVPIYRALYRKQSPATYAGEMFKEHVQWFEERLSPIIEECRRHITCAGNVWIWGIGDDFSKLWSQSPETFPPAKCRLVDRNPAKIGKHIGELRISPPDKDTCGIPDVILIAPNSHLVQKNIFQDAQKHFSETPIYILFRGAQSDATQ